jgi:hypothetical protein
MAAAIEERLEIVTGYGCHVTDVNQLSNTLTLLLEGKGRVAAVSHHGNSGQRAGVPTATGSIVTAADVLQAHHSGTKLRIDAHSVVTPLARELAAKHGVCLVQAGVR